MKKTLLTILAAASLMAVSCQKEAFSGKDAMPEGSIGFNAYTSTATTKGTIIEKTQVQAEGVGVFAFYQPAVSGQPVPFSTRKFVTPDFMYNQQVVFNGTDWTYSPIKYWPNNENDWLSFFAYAPYKENRRWDSMGISTNSNSDKLTVTFEVNEDVVSQEDILWASPKINQSNKMENSVNNTAKKVSFNFKHVTSKVDMMVGITTGSTADAWNDVNTEITLKSIVFNKLNSEFKYVYNINDAKLIEPATVDYCDGKTYNLTAEPNETVEKINESKWGIPSSPLHTQGIFTSEHVAKYGYFYAYLPTDQHLFLAPQVFTDQTVTITYVVKTTDSNNNQNGSTVTNSVTKSLASIFPYIGASTTERGLESGKCYNIKFLIGLDDVNIAADVQDWDTDIFEHETYVPANYTVSTWQNGVFDPATIVADQDLCINVRDISLNSTNSGFYRIKDYSAIPYALNELTEQVLAEEIAKSRLDPSESDLRFTKVDDANVTYVTVMPTTPQTVFETTTMCVATAGLTDNGVYVFEYCDPSGLKSYTLVKVGTAPTTTPSLTMTVEAGLPVVSEGIYYIDSDRQFTVAISENSAPVAGLRPSSFLITKGDPAEIVADAFTIVETSTAGTYQFTAKNVENQEVYTISLNSNPVASMKVKVATYSFSPATVTVMPGSTGVTTTLYLGDQIATGCTGEEGKGYFSFEGATGITIESVVDGVVTLSASNDVLLASDAKMIGTKGGIKVVELGINFASYPGTENTPAANWPLAKVGGVYWAPVNCGYDENHKFGLLYQHGRYAGSSYGALIEGTTSPYLEDDKIQEGATNPEGWECTNPEDNKFYVVLVWYHYTPDWYAESTSHQFTSWPQKSGDNKWVYHKIDNPCPNGWRVPTSDELYALLNVNNSWTEAGGPDNLPGVYLETDSNKLFLPATGWKSNDDFCVRDRGGHGCYWSSNKVSGSSGWYNGSGLYFDRNKKVYSSCSETSMGLAVRCVLKQ